MIDPRLNVIDQRLAKIKRLITVTGGKGGIGKSVTASVLALVLSNLGYETSLLDLDLCGPSDHIILGLKDRVLPSEDKGIIPPQVEGIKFMSIFYYAGSYPSPLRGEDISNAIIELLTITRWGKLDFLIIDLPPGISDATLDTIRLMRRAESLVLTTPAKIDREIVHKVLQLLERIKVPILGVVENKKTQAAVSIDQWRDEFKVPSIWGIDFDNGLEGAIGKAKKLLQTNFAKDVRKIVSDILNR